MEIEAHCAVSSDEISLHQSNMHSATLTLFSYTMLYCSYHQSSFQTKLCKDRHTETEDIFTMSLENHMFVYSPLGFHKPSKI